MATADSSSTSDTDTADTFEVFSDFCAAASLRQQTKPKNLLSEGELDELLATYCAVESPIVTKTIRSRSECLLRQSPPQFVAEKRNTLNEITAQEEEETDDDLDESDNIEELDLNATYSSKTMGRRKLSLMLQALAEEEYNDDEEELLAQQPKAKLTNLKLPAAIAQSLPKTMYKLQSPTELSPQTPRNTVPPPPERSFRICNYVRKPKLSYPPKEEPQNVDWNKWGHIESSTPAWHI